MFFLSASAVSFSLEWGNSEEKIFVWTGVHLCLKMSGSIYVYAEAATEHLIMRFLARQSLE